MKYLIVIFLFVALAVCLGSLGSDQSFNNESNVIAEMDSIVKSDGIASIQDEYWPFEKTVKQSDLSLLEVAHRLEITN